MRARSVAALAVLTAALFGACTSDTHQANPPTTQAKTRASSTLGESPLLTGPPKAGFISASFGKNAHTVSVWSWSGRRIANIRTNATAECCNLGSLSPDGTRLLIFNNKAGSKPAAQVLDRRGRVLAEVAGNTGAQWADDSRHLCELRPHESDAPLPDGPADLVLIDPGESEQIVAQVPGYGPHTQPVILRCSVVDDQAIVADQFTSQNYSITAVTLSTGHTFTPQWMPKGPGAQILAISGNGRYVLRPSGNGLFYVAVVDTRTGTTVGHVDGQPVGMSWAGHLVLELANGLDLQVVDWRTGAVLWRSGRQDGGPGGSGITAQAAVSARPFSDDLALAAAAIPGHDQRFADLWLVTPSQPPKLLDDMVARGVI